jgi:hypothetical protein
VTKPTPDFVDQLAAAAADARAVLAELRSENKETRRLGRELREERDKLIAATLDEAIKERIEPELEKLVGIIRETKDALLPRVKGMIDDYMNTCLYGNKQGRGTNIFDRIGAQLLEGEEALALLKQRVDAELRLRKVGE